MLGYICKYTPVELFESMGVTMERLEPQVAQFSQAETLMHPNVCSYVKAVLEAFAANPSEGIILTNCCDSVRRLSDTLKAQYPDKFFYILEVPRKVNTFAVGLYEKQVMKMMAAYAEFSGRAFDEDAFDDWLVRRAEAEAASTSDNDTAFDEGTDPVAEAIESSGDAISEDEGADAGTIKLGIMGARCNEAVLKFLAARKVQVLFNVTCTGMERRFSPSPSWGADGSREKLKDLVDAGPLNAYLEQVLCQFPCMRMITATNRYNYLEGFSDQLDGILYHTMKFCDVYAFEYTDLKASSDLPILEIETDSTRQSMGQIRTRVEAFIEELEIKKGLTQIARKKIRQEGQPLYIMGIDSGSTSTNAVLLDENRRILATSVVRTGAKTADSADRVLADILSQASLKREDLAMIVATGYGRVSIPFADTTITEISCHGKGAHFLNPDVRTILDIGGQDSKAIRLGPSGDVADFVMNDKCAAGTGRFLEAMARTLEVPIDDLGPISLEWKEDLDITSMCTVFAESEVISLIALNKEKADIAHAVHKAIAGKALSLMKKVGLEKAYMMTGGVAKNPGMVAVLNEKLGAPLYIYDEPEIIGALGAALFGLEAI